MFGKTSVRLEKDLLRRAARCSAIAGYSSVAEFVTHVLEKEMKDLEGAESEEEIRKRLKGLGYLS